ncbi:facilitated trehalose transporter Tret1-like isoform X2 [Cylas formicarius]|uniref:facilitated trehalose transporter Tret1-like isoform X2 n=1 Tax=Cylas formicarius TaxID=197179 RepID=UPI002958C7AE|nr:facilitated trehalose transporter Tret1-like isoform X2 [Cylas formicarius]
MTGSISENQGCRKKPISRVRRVLPQIIAVTVKNVLLFGFGMTLGFPTILIPNLSGDNPNEKIALDQEALSWIGSVNLLCVPLGCFLSGALTQPLGRRRAMQLVNLPFVAAWLLFFFATEVWQIFLALSLTGMTGGLLEAPTLTYLAEVTTPNLRGVLASTSTVAVIGGILTEFLFGTFFHWRTVALVSCVVPILSIATLFLVPESPHWLVSKNKLESAQKSIAWLRGFLPVEDAKQEFDELCEHLRKTSKKSTQGKKIIKLIENARLYTKSSFLWPFALVTLSFFLGHFCGMTTLQTYAVTIFATLKAPIDKYYATIILGVSEALGCIFSSTLVHFMGKRKMNFFSLIGCGVCFGVVGTYAFSIDVRYLQSAKITDPESLETNSWMPLTFLVGSAFFSHTGIRILPWMLIGEVYYNDIRATASGFSGAASYMLAFISNKIFFWMVNHFTLPGTFCFYSAVSFIGFVLLYFLLPETERKSLHEIAEHFGGGFSLTRKVAETNRETRNGGTVNEGFYDEEDSQKGDIVIKL